MVGTILVSRESDHIILFLDDLTLLLFSLEVCIRVSKVEADHNNLLTQ
jgi:hypothetical protein